VIQVSTVELRRIAGEQDQQARLLAGLLDHVRGLAEVAVRGLGDEEACLAVRLGEVLHVIDALGKNHAAVARGLRRAAEVYDGVDHPRVSGAAKML
jgi:hypothetical protein